MEFTGRFRFDAERTRVWDGLQDPAVLRAVIPGCERFTETTAPGADARRFEAQVKVRVGPLATTVRGAVTLAVVEAPIAYRLAGEGRALFVGEGGGDALVTLEPDLSGPAERTLLFYKADASVGGRLSRYGRPVLKKAARMIVAQFFLRLAKEIDIDAVELPAEPPAASPRFDAAAP